MPDLPIFKQFCTFNLRSSSPLQTIQFPIHTPLLYWSNCFTANKLQSSAGALYMLTAQEVIKVVSKDSRHCNGWSRDQSYNYSLDWSKWFRPNMSNTLSLTIENVTFRRQLLWYNDRGEMSSIHFYTDWKVMCKTILR